MNRNFILFIVSFIVAAIVCGCVFFFLKREETARHQQEAQQAAERQAKVEQPQTVGQPQAVEQPKTTPEPDPAVKDTPQPEPEPQPDEPAADTAPASQAVVQAFVDAVQRGDMAAARGMIDGKEVTDATIAGLCMVFEDGAYRLREKLPIRNTFENDAHSGYLVYVTPQQAGTAKPGNIGVELAKAEDAWRITHVSMDSLLSSYEDQGTQEAGHYFPLVKNPKGGDSLALFFAFDDATLTPRSLRQLEIVAQLLKQSRRQLDISGHTDDVGTAEYNQQLSEKRAAAVRDALVSYGVDAAQISTRGMGMSQPRRTYAQGDSEEQIDTARGENRRAEIYLDFE